MKSLWLCEVFQNIFSKGEAENPNDFLALTDFIYHNWNWMCKWYIYKICTSMYAYIAIAMIIYSRPE